MQPSTLRALVVAGGAAWTALALAMGCGPGDLSDLTRGEPAVTAPPTEDSAAPPAPIATCRTAEPPPKPAQAGSTTALPEVLFAFDNMRIDALASDTTATLPVPESLNLDRNCSCEASFSCVPPDGGDRAKVCDPKDGRDNVTGALLGELARIVPSFRPTFVKKRLDDGIFTLLVSILDWNGEANDDRVIVGVRLGSNIDNGLEGDKRIKPRLDGEDRWAVDPGSLVTAPPVGTPCTTDQCVPLTLDVEGYVTNNTLVARWEKLPFAFSSARGRITVPLLGAVLVAEVKTEGALRRLDGQLVGRLLANDLLATAGAFNPEEPGPLQDLCTSDVAYGIFKSTICATRDLAANAKDDNTGVPCGALSEAVRFTAVTAKLGTVQIPQIDGTAGTCRPPDTCP